MDTRVKPAYDEICASPKTAHDGGMDCFASLAMTEKQSLKLRFWSNSSFMSKR